MHEHKPLIAISMGDPSGCGPEVVAMASGEKNLPVRLVCIGDHAVMQRAVRIVG